MLTIKFLGGEAALRTALAPWPEMVPVGGHTDLLVNPAMTDEVARAKAVFTTLVTVYKWTAIDTTAPTAPRRVDVLEITDQTTDLVLFPQIAGG